MPQVTQQKAGDSSQLTIGEVARRTGLRTSAVRYYESVGLLPLPPRLNGRRRYGPDVVRLLQTIRFAQDAGFSVAEVKTLFHGFEASVRPSARWRALAARKLVELDALVARAEIMREALRTGMRCGCLRIEDCDFVPGEGCTVPGPVLPARRVRRPEASA
jgi:MerR family redox-sensitive transcriptional activator SoxR